MAWEESTPLEQDQIRSQDKALDLPRPLDGNQASFLSIEDPDLLLDTWKPAEDGNGTILRLIDLGGQSRIVAINVPLLSIGKITSTDAVERDQKPIVPENPHGFKISVQPHQIVTIRLVAGSM
jgi:alpha-mannosidase